MKRSAVVAVCVLCTLFVVTPAGRANTDFECPPVIAGTVDGNLIIPAGVFCVFGPGTVKGNVIARERSNVVLFDVVVEGNVEATKADAVWMSNRLSGAAPNIVRGNIHLVEGGPSTIFTNEVVICNTTVQGGNIQIEKRTGSILIGRSLGCINRIERGGIKIEDNIIPAAPDFMELSFNTMAWDLQVFKNVGAGFKFVQNNTHLGALQCTENSPPFFGGPNNGTGPDDRGDQCFDTIP